ALPGTDGMRPRRTPDEAYGPAGAESFVVPSPHCIFIDRKGGSVPVSTFENRDASFDPGTLLARAGWLRGLAAGLVADRDEAEDLVQDTFLAAIERPPRAPRALGS